MLHRSHPSRSGYAVVLTGFLVLQLGAVSAWGQQKKPNIVFLLSDQWRASAMGHTGDPNVKTPNLDQLAGASSNFTNAISVCPVCTPYRASLLTGRFPTTTGMFLNDAYMPAEEVCMAEIFKQGGYDTGYIGKWHLDGHGRGAYIPPDRRQGFDYWKAAECDHGYNHSHYYEGASDEKKYWEGYDAFAQTRDARRYLAEHAKADRPFLLVVAYGTPHFPHDSAPPQYKAMYPIDKIQLPPSVPTEWKERALKEAVGYYAHCTALDQCVGDLVTALDELRLANNTILVFTSDHGEMLGSQGKRPFTKQVPWDESAHVPFLLRAPGAPRRPIQEPINTPDILPTLLGLAGIAAPKTIEGEDLSTLIRGQRPERDRAVLYMSVSPFDIAAKMKEYRAVRTARHTYVRDIDGPWLLYDNQADRHQLSNLINKPECAELQKALEARLQQELKNARDEFKPRQFYLDKFGYVVNKAGIIGYAEKETKVQSPRRGD